MIGLMEIEHLPHGPGLRVRSALGELRAADSPGLDLRAAVSRGGETTFVESP